MKFAICVPLVAFVGRRREDVASLVIVVLINVDSRRLARRLPRRCCRRRIRYLVHTAITLPVLDLLDIAFALVIVTALFGSEAVAPAHAASGFLPPHLRVALGTLGILHQSIDLNVVALPVAMAGVMTTPAVYCALCGKN